MNVVKHGTSLVFGVLSSFLISAGCVSGDPNGSTQQEVSDQDPSLHCMAGSDWDADRACSIDEVKKTTICHVPPGNPMNAHTLCVGTPSVEAHLAHGDYLGACRPLLQCEPPVDTTEPPPLAPPPPTEPPPTEPTPPEPTPTEPTPTEPPPTQL